MKNYFFSLFGASLFLFASCSKEAVTTTTTTDESKVVLASLTVVPTLNAALTANLSGSTATQWEVAGKDLFAAKIENRGVTTYAYFQAEDGAFLMLKDAKGATLRGGKHHCKGDTIALASVPASAIAYVTTNYPSSTIKRACADTISGVVTYRLNLKSSTDNDRVTLIFDSNWVFVKAVTKTKGEHGQGTEVAINVADVNALATAYIAANYAGYTVTKAESNTDKAGVVTYEVKITNGTANVELVFDAAWAFVKANTKGGNGGGGDDHNNGGGGGGDDHNNNGGNGGGDNHGVDVAVTDLPAAIATYVSTNYAGYSINKAEKDTDKAGVVTYEVEIKNASTEVDLIFDANGIFVKVK